MPVSRAVRAVLSAACWTLAVVMGVVTAGSLAGGGVLCESGTHQACKPQTWLLVVGAVLTLGLGAAGALLWKPRPKGPQRRPWEYGP
jgi:hypothetical protein